MEPTEILARATIAAALIMARAVELPTLPTSGGWSQDNATLRLRDLTDYVYQMITTPKDRQGGIGMRSEKTGRSE